MELKGVVSIFAAGEKEEAEEEELMLARVGLSPR